MILPPQPASHMKDFGAETLQNLLGADHLKDSLYYVHNLFSQHLLRIGSVLVPETLTSNINIVNNYKSESIMLWEDLLSILNGLGAPPYLIEEHAKSKKNAISFDFVKKVLDRFLISRPSKQQLVSKNIIK